MKKRARQSRTSPKSRRGTAKAGRGSSIRTASSRSGGASGSRSVGRSRARELDVDVVVVEAGRGLAPSPYAERALRVFRRGVRDALVRLGEERIPVVVQTNGQTVRGIPVRAGRSIGIQARKRSGRGRSH